MAESLIFLGILFILAALIARSIVFVPTFNVGAVRRFGALTKRVLLPGGPYFLIPFAEDVLLTSVENEEITLALQRKPVSIKLISKDRLQIVVEGSIQYRVDPALLDRFLLVGKNAWEGMIDAIKSELGQIAGCKVADVFIERRQALQDLINCVLRLSTPPHQNPSVLGKEFDDKIVIPEHRLEFYEKHMTKIKNLLKAESRNSEDRSTIEKRYGIDVVTFELAKVDFSEETLKAMESERQAKDRMKASRILAARKLSLYRRLRKEGLGPQEAINEAAVTVGQAEKKIVSVEGLKNIFGGDKQ